MTWEGLNTALIDLGFKLTEIEQEDLYTDFFRQEQFLSAAIVDEIVEDSASKNLDEIRMEILGKIIAFYQKQRGKSLKMLFEPYLK